jgi:hypothetical protein
MAILRRKLLIYPKFQLFLMILNLLITAATFGIVLVQSHRSFNRFVELGQSIRLPAQHPYFELVGYQQGRMDSSLILAFLASMILSTATTLIVSHRLAGPLVRTKRYFEEVARSGTIRTELRFRKGDFLSDLPEVINQALSRIRDRSK